MNTFLFCHRGALGDFIMTWPLIHTLRKIFPKHEFFFIGKPEYMRFAASKGLLDAYMDCESASLSDFFNGESMSPGIATHFAGSVLWMEKSDNLFRLLKENSDSSPIFIRPFPQFLETHVSRYYYEEARKSYPLPDLKDEYNIPLNLDRATKSGTYCVIHPGSGSLKKNFSVDFFIKTAEYIADTYRIKTHFVLGPVEIERGMHAKFAGHLIETPKNLFEFEKILANAGLFIGNDSGASHLASALGVKTIALYKTSDPDIWGTIGKNSCNVKPGQETPDIREIIDKYLKNAV